jgi:hypothetical protein
MTISEHSGIDDLMVVCLHFAKEVDEASCDIFKHGGDLYLVKSR